jgi:hypothetical protein
MDQVGVVRIDQPVAVGLDDPVQVRQRGAVVVGASVVGEGLGRDTPQVLARRDRPGLGRRSGPDIGGRGSGRRG